MALVIMDQHHLVLPLGLMIMVRHLVIMDHLLALVIWDHYLPCLLVCLLAPLLALGIMDHPLALPLVLAILDQHLLAFLLA